MLQALGRERFPPALSVALLLEYESTCKRQADEMSMTHSDIDDVLDYFCRVADKRNIFFLWRWTGWTWAIG